METLRTEDTTVAGDTVVTGTPLEAATVVP